jgi:sugar O-acyltransferase (sialic acid O-acetyltransferase NeuD family)
MKLLIVGAGGHGRCCLDIVRENNVYEEICFLDDSGMGSIVNGVKIAGNIESLNSYSSDYHVFVAVGNNVFREKLMIQAKELGHKVITLVSSKSIVSDYAIVQEGTVVFPGAVVEANAKIGRGCIIAANTTINHDAVIEDYALVNSNSVIRPNAVLKSKAKVGSRCVVTFGQTIEAEQEILDGQTV